MVIIFLCFYLLYSTFIGAMDHYHTECPGTVRLIPVKKGEKSIVEYLKLDAQELMTGKTYRQLIVEQTKRTEVALIARQETKNTVDYYDAYQFLKESYPGIFNDEVEMVSFNALKEEKKNQDLEDVRFYSLFHPEQQAFSFLGTERHFLTNELLQTFFFDIFCCRNTKKKKFEPVRDVLLWEKMLQSTTKALDYFKINGEKRRQSFDMLRQIAKQKVNRWACVLAKAYLAEIYFFGIKDIARDYEESQKLFVKISQQSVSSYVKYLALVRMGFLYKRANLAPQMLHAFEFAANQMINAWARSQAHIELGIIYKHGFGTILQNDSIAFSYYEEAIKQNENLTAHAYASVCLAEYYFFGGFVTRNYKKALQYYEQALIVWSNKSWTRANILATIGDIYSVGGNGVDQDEKKAIQFYNWAIEIGNPEVSGYAQQKLNAILKPKALAVLG